MKLNGLWILITAIVTTAMLCGTAVYISNQNIQAQKEIADKQTKAINDLSDQIGVGAGNIKDGLTDVKRGICKIGNTDTLFC